MSKKSTGGVPVAYYPRLNTGVKINRRAMRTGDSMIRQETLQETLRLLSACQALTCRKAKTWNAKKTTPKLKRNACLGSFMSPLSNPPR